MYQEVNHFLWEKGGGRVKEFQNGGAKVRNGTFDKNILRGGRRRVRWSPVFLGIVMQRQVSRDAFQGKRTNFCVSLIIAVRRTPRLLLK